MAGLFGYYSPHKAMPPELLLSMARPLFHDSNYRFSSIVKEWGGLGVVDHQALEGNNQIHHSPPDTYWVFRGVLWNNTRLENCTGSIDLAGKCFRTPVNRDLIKDIRGQFAAAILDDKAKEIHLITDHFGLYPIYIYQDSDILLFSSELKSIIASGMIKVKNNKDAISLMLCVGEVCSNQTLIDKIETLSSATHLTASVKGISTSRYYAYEYNENHNANWNEMVATAGRLLQQAVRRSVKGYSSVAVPLSGGLDSRALLYFASKETSVDSFTWGVDGCRDRVFAKEVARSVHSSHHDLTMRGDYLIDLAAKGVWLTEGLTSATNFHVLPFVDTIAADCNVVLDGFAGDVIYGGNFNNREWMGTVDISSAAEAIWNWRHKAVIGNDILNRKYLVRQYADARAMFTSLFQDYPGKSGMDKAMAFLMDNRVRRNTLCGSEMLRSKLGAIQPFMDVDLMDWSRTIPHQWKSRHRFYLEVISNNLHETASCRWQRTGLPASMPYWMSWLSLAVQRGYEVFSNKVLRKPAYPHKSPAQFDLWFRDDLALFVKNLLLSERSLDRDWIPADLLIKRVTGHLNGESDCSFFLGVCITLELFARQFMDDIDVSINKYSFYKDNVKVNCIDHGK